MVSTLDRPPVDASPFTPEQVTYALTRLGSSSVDVYRTLEDYQARGVRHDCTLCPVARYLEAQFGQEFHVNYERATWCDPDTARWFDVALTAPVALFVAQFDNGGWARLADPNGLPTGGEC